MKVSPLKYLLCLHSRLSRFKAAPANLTGIIMLSMGLASCGGGGGGSASSPELPSVVIATGQFKDSNVEGLSYSSGAQTGVTDENGMFTYEVGRTVTFSIGEVVLGTVAGKPLVTPVDLVPDGSLDSPAVLNIVSFLLTLDEDGNAANGITISSAVRDMAANWAQIDFTGGSIPGGLFSAANLSEGLISIISDAASADGGLHAWPDFITARGHMETTLLCAHAGAFRGTFSGDDQGTFGVIVDAHLGFLSGLAFSTLADQLSFLGSGFAGSSGALQFISATTDDPGTFSVLPSEAVLISARRPNPFFGSTPVDIDGDGSFVSTNPAVLGFPLGELQGVLPVPATLDFDPLDFILSQSVISPGATYTGAFESVDEVLGSWEKDLTSGSFVGARIGGDSTASYRFTASYLGEGSGILTFDIDDADNVSGIIYNVATDSILTLSGSLSADQVLSATASDGRTITGHLFKGIGLVSGTVVSDLGDPGAGFSGSGCKLN